MKFKFLSLLAVVSSTCLLYGQPFVGSFYAPDIEGGVLITLKEERGLYSGTLRVEGEVHQVQCKLEGDVLNGQVLGKPIAVNMVQKGDHIELTIADVKWGALVDDSTARTYVLTLQGETSSAAANYVQATEGGVETVVFNGQILNRKQLEDFYEKYHRYPRPGNYWYDPVSGLYGAVGYDAFGYMHPGHNFGPLQSSVSRGDSRFYVNGRCLSKREVLVWNKLIGRDMRPGNYFFDAKGNFGIEGGRNPLYNFFELGRSYGTPEDVPAHFWAAQFGKHRRDGRGRGGFISVPGFGPPRYGFGGP